MLVAIGILIILLLIIIIYYQALIAEKVKVEDAEIELKAHLQSKFNIKESNIKEQINFWEKEGIKLDATGYQLLEKYSYFLNAFETKSQSFPYSLLSELFLKKKNN